MSDESEVPWRRLAVAVVWIDAASAAVSLVPVALAVLVFNAPMDSAAVWSTAAVAGTGLISAATDLWRWWKTRYRITSTHVEVRTGLAVRNHRSIRRERIRSVDTHARLRHRLARLHVVTIGAGQQVSGESALMLDAVSTTTARWLRRELLETARAPSKATPHEAASRPNEVPPRTLAERDIATIKPAWTVHNIFTVWALLMAGGVLWGTYWAVQLFGVDAPGVVERVLDWNPYTAPTAIAIGLALMWVLGVGGLALNHIAETWRFRLVRVDGDTTVLRTTQGLFSTREVNRDVARIRGVDIGEPLLWRFMGTADTNLISTGLTGFTFAKTAGSTILPRTHVSLARRVAHDVLDTAHEPLSVDLTRHPHTALRRRFGWALAIGAVAFAGAWLTTWPWAFVIAGGVLALGLGLAVASFTALGHALVGPFLVVRSGGWYRSTSVLRRDAIIGWTLRQSLLQRRLGLMSAMASTSAGTGGYWIRDAAEHDTLGFTVENSPHLLRPFLDDGQSTDRHVMSP